MTYDEHNNIDDKFQSREEGDSYDDDIDSSQVDKETRLWSMLIHLSIFANAIGPLVGMIAPMLIWQIKKEELPGVDPHGRNVANFIISMMIYVAVSIVLAFFIIGFFFLLILGIVGVVFPIIGGLKANNGEVWEYPLMIRFF